jgi:hypothetical protein
MIKKEKTDENQIRFYDNFSVLMRKSGLFEEL